MDMDSTPHYDPHHQPYQHHRYHPQQHGTSQSCTCRSDLSALQQRITQTRCLEVVDMFDLSETLTASFDGASRCENGCYPSTNYTRTLLDTVARLLDFFDATWETVRTEGYLDSAASTSSRRGSSIIYTSGSGSSSSGKRRKSSTGSSSRGVEVTGWKAVATLNGRFVLDEGERRVLLQEMLRGAMAGLNALVEDVVSARAKGGDGPAGVAGGLLERTYSALARYGGHIA